MNWNKKYNKLYKTYKNRLINISKNTDNYDNSNLLHFITYLQYMRDYFILHLDDKEDIKNDIKISSLSTAIYAYYKYQACIYEYFDTTTETLKPKNNLSREEAEKLYQRALDKYWNNLWGTVFSYMEVWENAFNIQ